MTDLDRIQRALQFATEKHKGQKRIGGDDYITHPVAVCEIVKNLGFGEDYQIAALFHDLLEDTNATEKEILEYGNEEVLKAVKLLTKQDGFDMAEYVGGIKTNDIALKVKTADRLHNLQSALVTSVEFKKRYTLPENPEEYGHNRYICIYMCICMYNIGVPTPSGLG